MNNIIGSLFKDYCNEVLKDILPNQQVSGISSADSLITAIRLDNTNQAFIGSNYYASVYNKKFIHFTNLEKLTSILLEKKIRLYDLNYVDDKNEILFPFNYCNLSNPSFKEENVNELRKYIYSFSFCDVDMQELDEYSMWRSYGHDGNGIAIQFSFKNDEALWNGFRLSRIYYNEETLLKNIAEAYLKFNEYIDRLETTEKYTKGNDYYHFLNHILSLLAFHKVQIYQSEKEYRLIYDSSQASSLPKESPFYLQKNRVINKSKEISKFFKIPIADNDLSVNELIPLIKIEAIIFGYRYKDEDFIKLEESVNEIMAWNSMQKPEFKITALKNKYFK